jgi:hypothetical protein
MDATGLLATAPFEDEGTLARAGATYFFDLTKAAEPPVRLVAPNADANDGVIPKEFIAQGYAAQDWGSLRVALSDELVAIGVSAEGSASVDNPLDNSAPMAGAVYVYDRAHLDAPPQYIKAPTIESGAFFGECISLSGSWLAVGAPGEDHVAKDSGAVYMYERRNGRFGDPPAYIKPSIAHQADGFGNAVKIDGDLLVVSAAGESSKSTGVDGDPNDTSAKGAGAVYVYRWSGDQWSSEAYVKPQVAAPFTFFGHSLSVSDGRFVVGAPGAAKCPDTPDLGGNSGVAYVVGETQGVWSVEQCLTPARRSVLFGFGVGLLGNRLVVGAPWEWEDDSDGSRAFSGAAYLYEGSPAGVWTQSGYIRAPNADADDVFGFSVGIAPGLVAVGAIQESGGESGPSANRLDNSAHYAGATYLFSVGAPDGGASP